MFLQAFNLLSVICSLPEMPFFFFKPIDWPHPVDCLSPISFLWQSTPVFLPGESHGWRRLVGYSPRGRRVGHDWATSPHFHLIHINIWAFLVAQRLKHLPLMRETWVQSLDWEDPLEEGMATHSSIFVVWRIPWMEEPGGLQSTGLQRVGHNWAT